MNEDENNIFFLLFSLFLLKGLERRLLIVTLYQPCKYNKRQPINYYLQQTIFSHVHLLIQAWSAILHGRVFFSDSSIFFYCFSLLLVEAAEDGGIWWNWLKTDLMMNTYCILIIIMRKVGVGGVVHRLLMANQWSSFKDVFVTCPQFWTIIHNSIKFLNNSNL